MTKLKITFCLLFLTTAYFVTACDEEIDIEGVDKGSLEYWCLTSGGELSNGTCFCGSQKCQKGSVCKSGANDNRALECSRKY